MRLLLDRCQKKVAESCKLRRSEPSIPLPVVEFSGGSLFTAFVSLASCSVWTFSRCTGQMSHMGRFQGPTHGFLTRFRQIDKPVKTLVHPMPAGHQHRVFVVCQVFSHRNASFSSGLCGNSNAFSHGAQSVHDLNIVVAIIAPGRENRVQQIDNFCWERK